jgi:hypothetical protein
VSNNTEVQRLIDDATAILKTTTVGYAGHSAAWRANQTTAWWRGLDKLAQARALLDPPATPPPVVTGAVANAVGPFGTPAPAWTDTSKWRSDSASLASLLKSSSQSAVMAGGSYGVAVVFASATDPTVTVQNLTGWGTVPGTLSFRCPAQAKPAAGSDGHLVVVQPDGSQVELFVAVRVGANWTARAVCKAKAGDFTYPVASCRGSSFTLPAGLITPDEVKAGRIGHALLAILPTAAVSKSWVWPSNASDGVNAGGVPEGARLVLDPNASLSGLTAFEKLVGQALKDYGAFVGDKTSGSDLSFQAQGAESWTAFGKPNPWDALGLGGYPSLNGLLPLLERVRVAA